MMTREGTYSILRGSIHPIAWNRDSPKFRIAPVLCRLVINCWVSLPIDTRTTLGGKNGIHIVTYDAVRHRRGVREVLAKNGWEERYIAGQLAGLDVLSGDPLPGMRGKVCVSETEGGLNGFVSVEYRGWNRLGQLQGLAVDPDLKRRRLGSALVRRAEEFVRGVGGRGLYVDTPVTNEIGGSFYEALGYRQAYVMPEYYGEGLDGVTYLKLFSK
jgi:ribosomal protein S18 acetylase RimI-like enzyme